MIEYGLSKHQLKELKRFSHIFHKTNDEMVLDCILLILCTWNENRNHLIRIEPDINDLDLSIELTSEIEDELYDLSDYYDLSVHDCINGIVEFILKYLDLNWSGEYGLESEDMTNQEKLEELKHKNNDSDNHCWVKYFG